MTLLTKSQKAVLDFIFQHLERTGVSPSYREIQKHLGVKAVGTVQDHVEALIRKGKLQRVPSEVGRRSRGVIPVGRGRGASKEIPIYGEIAAGSPSEAPELILGSLWIANSFARDPCFALRVRGDSMVDAGIWEGDLVVVEQKRPVRSGDIVVALLEGESTVKRWLVKGEKKFLVPENSRLRPIDVSDRTIEIQGKVVGLQRRLN